MEERREHARELDVLALLRVAVHLPRGNRHAGTHGTRDSRSCRGEKALCTCDSGRARLAEEERGDVAKVFDVMRLRQHIRALRLALCALQLAPQLALRLEQM